MATAAVAVELVGGRSTATRCFSKYPLKLIIPNKVGSSSTDSVWIYTLSYGGGIVSGDSVSCRVSVGDGCTAAMTTQASTKVYKSVGSKCSEQVLEADIGSQALLAVIPDPITCFSTARYIQKQVFNVCNDSNLVLVDWITSGRHESGEKWEFDLYRSTNHIFEGDRPLFVDSILLERRSIPSISRHMQDYQVIAMVVMLGPKTKYIQSKIREEVKQMMSCNLRIPMAGTAASATPGIGKASARPYFIASCSAFGPKGDGFVVRIAATTTESVYGFLRHHLAGLEPLLGAFPYS